MDKKQLTQETKEKIKFLMTVAIFFTGFYLSFGKAIGDSEIISNKNILSWGVGVAFSITSYLFISWAGERVNRFWHTLIKILIDICVVSFVLMMIVMAFVSNKPLSGYWEWPFVISIHVSLWTPIVTFFLVLISLDWTIFSKVGQELRNWFDRR